MEKFRTVPDTNVLIAAENGSAKSPNREYFSRWKQGEFNLLFSDDTLKEYIKKLKDFKAASEDIKTIVKYIQRKGLKVEIVYFHFHKYPKDKDDIAFILCAENGEATHLISYNRDLLEVKDYFQFKICRTLDFLYELRTTTQRNDP